MFPTERGQRIRDPGAILMETAVKGTGTMTIKIEGAKHFYEFDYTLAK